MYVLSNCDMEPKVVNFCISSEVEVFFGGFCFLEYHTEKKEKRDFDQTEAAFTSSKRGEGRAGSRLETTTDETLRLG